MTDNPHQGQDLEIRRMIERAKEDRNAYTEIYNRFLPEITRAAYAILGNWAAAEDVAQDTLVRGFKHVNKLDPCQSLSGWFHRTARNRAVDYLRRTHGLVLVGHAPQALEGEYNDTDGTDVTDEVSDCLRRLKAREREVVTLRIVEEMGFQQLADRMGIPVTTAHDRYRRGLASVRKCLEEKGVTPMGAKSKSGRAVVGLIRQCLDEQQASMAKATASSPQCPSFGTIHDMALGKAAADQERTHVAGCSRCRRLLEHMRSALSSENEEPDQTTVLLRWVEYVAKSCRQAEPQDAPMKQASGFYAKQRTYSEAELDEESNFTVELVALIETLMNPNVPIHDRCRLAAELRDVALQRICRRRRRKR